MTLDAVRFSNLKHIAQSPAHYLHNITVGKAKKRPMTVGTVAHSMVLGGETPVIFNGVRNKKSKKWIEFQAQNPDRLILIPSEYEAALGCANSIRSHKRAMELLEGDHEQELPHWTIAGRECGGRPDARHPRRITELKTSATSEPYRFTRLGTRMAYHAQLAWYLDGNTATGGTATEAYIVVVEATPPFIVTTMPVVPRALDEGRKLYSIWLEQLRVCEESDAWPGYAQRDVDFDVQDGAIDFTFAEEEAPEESSEEAA